MFKKYVAVLLSGLMLVSAVSLTGCGNSSKDSDSGKSDAKTEDSKGGDNLAESKELLQRQLKNSKQQTIIR